MYLGLLIVSYLTLTSTTTVILHMEREVGVYNIYIYVNIIYTCIYICMCIVCVYIVPLYVFTKVQNGLY